MIELWLVDLDAAAPALEALERDLPRLSGDDRARALRPNDAHERRQPPGRLHGAACRSWSAWRAPRCAGKGSCAAPAASLAWAPAAPTFSLSHTAGPGADRCGAHRRHRRRSGKGAPAQDVAPPPRGDPGRGRRARGRARGDPDQRRGPAARLVPARGLRQGPRRGAVAPAGRARAAQGRRPAAPAAAKSPPPPGVWRARPASRLPMSSSRTGLYGAVAAPGLAQSPRPRHFPARCRKPFAEFSARRSSPVDRHRPAGANSAHRSGA